MGLCETSNFSIFAFSCAGDLKVCTHSYSNCFYLTMRFKVWMEKVAKWWRHTSALLLKVLHHNVDQSTLLFLGFANSNISNLSFVFLPQILTVWIIWGHYCRLIYFSMAYVDLQIRKLPYKIQRKLADILDIPGIMDWRALISEMPENAYTPIQVGQQNCKHFVIVVYKQIGQQSQLCVVF